MVLNSASILIFLCLGIKLCVIIDGKKSFIIIVPEKRWTDRKMQERNLQIHEIH